MILTGRLHLPDSIIKKGAQVLTSTKVTTSFLIIYYEIGSSGGGAEGET